MFQGTIDRVEGPGIEKSDPCIFPEYSFLGDTSTFLEFLSFFGQIGLYLGFFQEVMAL